MDLRLSRIGLFVVVGVFVLLLLSVVLLGDPDDNLSATPGEFADVRLGMSKADVYFIVGSTPAEAREGILECWYYDAEDKEGYSYRFCFTGSVDFSDDRGRLVSKAFVPGTP